MLLRGQSPPQKARQKARGLNNRGLIRDTGPESRKKNIVGKTLYIPQKTLYVAEEPKDTPKQTGQKVGGLKKPGVNKRRAPEIEKKRFMGKTLYIIRKTLYVTEEPKAPPKIKQKRKCQKSYFANKNLWEICSKSMAPDG